MNNAHQPEGDEEESGIDTCSVCLNLIAADEAFLDKCYHRFHFQCLLHWTDTQEAHPTEAGPMYCCPLCKATYTSILHGLQGSTFRQHWVVPQQQARPSFLSLTPQQLRRRSLYAAAQPFKPALVSSIRKSSVAPAQRQAWVERELQAITLEDEVKVVSQVVLRTVTALEKSMSTQGTRHKTHSCDVSLLSPEQQQDWQHQITAAVQPFIPDHAAQFAGQLLGFLASKLTVQGHDQAVFGNLHSATARPQQTLNNDCDGKQRERSPVEYASSSEPSTESRGLDSDTDSEGYVALLQVQTSRHHDAPERCMVQSGGSDTVQSGHSLSQNTEVATAGDDTLQTSSKDLLNSNAAGLTLPEADFSNVNNGRQIPDGMQTHSLFSTALNNKYKKSRHSHTSETKHRQHKCQKSA